MLIIFYQGVYLGENTAQSASVEFLRYAKKLCAQRAAKFAGKARKGFFGIPEIPRRFSRRGIFV